MGLLRKTITISTLTLLIACLGTSLALYSKAQKIGDEVFAEYEQFYKAHVTIIGVEGFYDTPENEKQGWQLLHAAMAKYPGWMNNWADACLATCFLLLPVFCLSLLWSPLIKGILWLRSNPRKAVIFFAVVLFFFTWIWRPCIWNGHIFYCFIFSRAPVFWGSLLIEWTIILLPSAFIYKRLYESDMRSNRARKA